MTVLWEVRKIFRLGVPKTRKIKKVTTSQDDGFVEEVESFNHGRWFWTGPHVGIPGATEQKTRLRSAIG
jgi:hypothetical protein